jgi:hypothetical protein
MPIDTGDGPSDVERWADMRARSAARNRIGFLWGTAFLAVAFGVGAIDMLLVRTWPGTESFLGFRTEDAANLLRITVPGAIVSTIVHLLVRRFWPRGLGP